jgi:hypothetical protein
MLLEGYGSASREGVSVLDKLFDEKGPPFVKGSDGVVCGLNFGYIGGSDEVKEQVGSQNWCFSPLCDVEKGKSKWCDVVAKFFPVGNGGYYLLEVGLVIDSSGFRVRVGFGGACVFEGPPLFVEV